VSINDDGAPRKMSEDRIRGRVIDLTGQHKPDGSEGTTMTNEDRPNRVFLGSFDSAADILIIPQELLRQADEKLAADRAAREAEAEKAEAEKAKPLQGASISGKLRRLFGGGD
jgi:hypothetical protein